MWPERVAHFQQKGIGFIEYIGVTSLEQLSLAEFSGE